MANVWNAAALAQEQRIPLQQQNTMNYVES